MKTLEQHEQDVLDIKKQLKEYVKSGNDQKLMFTHVGSHSTRERSRHTYNNINISHLQDIIFVDLKNKEVLTEPSVPMDKLVETTLKYGLLPEVVTEFPKITVGGAIEGAALESSSFKHGQFNDCCNEYTIITPEGKTIKASRTKNSDMFFGKTGSYGSLGLLTSVKLKLMDATKYVLLQYTTFGSIEEAMQFMKKSTSAKYDYLEGILFDKTRITIITGQCVEEGNYLIQTFNNSNDPWFYKHVDKISREKDDYSELVPIFDYLFRYNRGAYWMGKYFLKYVGGYNFITRTVFNSSLTTERMYEALHLGNLSQSFFVQDFYIPSDNVERFIDYIMDRLNIFPLWLCPVKSTQRPEKLSPHYNKSSFIVNVGIYGKSKEFSADYLKANRDVECVARKLNGRKMLYAHAYYPKKEFWKIYDKNWYDSLRKKYHADKMLSDVFERTHVSETYKSAPIKVQ